MYAPAPQPDRGPRPSAPGPRHLLTGGEELSEVRPLGARALVAAGALLALFATLAVLSLRQKSVTTDEITYVASGYHHLRVGDFRLNATNPPLMKLVTALPLLALDPELPATERAPADLSELEQWRWARRFLYENRVDADAMLFAARLPVVALGLLLGVAVFLWTRQLYGERAALLALALYTLSPNVLAHARLATQDFALAAFTFAVAWSLWAYLRRPCAQRLVLLALAFSAAALTKTSAVFLLPILGAYALWLVVWGEGLGTWTRLPLVARLAGTRPRAAQTLSLAWAGLAIAGVFLVALNLCYGFQGCFRPLASLWEPERVLARLGGEGSALAAVAAPFLHVPLPVPEPFLRLLHFQATRVAAGNNVYFAGATSHEGWWYLMFVAIAVKTPLPMLLLAGAALAGFARARAERSAEWMVVIVCAGFLALFAALKSVNVGLRYVLPIYPLLHVFAGRLVRDGSPLPRFAAPLLALTLAWYAAGTLRLHPDYLASFNELAGGPAHGHELLADSNLDWGQDLKGLKVWMDEHDVPRIRLAYFGSADARYYGIDYDYLPSVGLAPNGPGERWWYELDDAPPPPLELQGGPMAVSASLLAGVFYPGYYAPLRELEPIGHVGHSILIYDPR